MTDDDIWSVSTPFPSFPPYSWLPVQTFVLPITWDVENEILRAKQPNSVTLPQLTNAQRKAARERKEKELAHAIRTSWQDQVQEENKRAGQDAQRDCLLCQRTEAIFAANSHEIQHLQRQWRAIQLKHEALVASQWKQETNSAPPAPTRSDALCGFHLPLLNDPKPLTSINASASQPLLPHPIPVPRLSSPRPSEIAPNVSTWSELDRTVFACRYELPDVSAGPEGYLKEEQKESVPMEDVDAHGTMNGTSTPSASPRKKLKSENGVGVPVPPSPADSTSSLNDHPAVRKLKHTKGPFAESIRLQAELAKTRDFNDLPIGAMHDDSGRRSSRVQKAIAEAERTKVEEKKDEEHRRNRTKELLRKQAEKEAIERITGGGSIQPAAAKTARVAASLTSFSQLLGVAAPEALIHHKHGAFAEADSVPMSPAVGVPIEKREREALTQIQLCIRSLEVASFISSPDAARNLAKSSKIVPWQVTKLTGNALKVVRDRLRRIDTPIHELRKELSQPDLQGLPPVHQLIRLGQIDALECLLSIAQATKEDLLPLDLSDDEIRDALVERKEIVPSVVAEKKKPSATGAIVSQDSSVATKTSSRPSKRAKLEKTETITTTTVKLEDNVVVKKGPREDSTMTDVPPTATPAVKSEDLVPLIPRPSASEIELRVTQRQSDLQTLVKDLLSSRETSTGSGFSPLLYALYSSAGESDDRTLTIIKLLLDRSPSLSRDTDFHGKDGLMWCALRRLPNCAKLLLDTIGNKDLQSKFLNDSSDQHRNTAVHYALAAAMDATCTGCTDCIRLYVAPIESQMGIKPSVVATTTHPSENSNNEETNKGVESAPSASPSPPPITTPIHPAQRRRLLPWSSLPPFLLPTLLNLQPILSNPTLHALVTQTLWKGEVRIRAGIEQQVDTLTADGDAMTVDDSSGSSGVSATPAAALSPSPPPPTSSTIAASPSTTPEHLSAFFLSLLRLWRTLVHTDWKRIPATAPYAPILSPLVQSLASLLPLGLFLEPPSGHAREGEDELILVRISCGRKGKAFYQSHRIKSGQLALSYVHASQGISVQKPNLHGLTPIDLVNQWSVTSSTGSSMGSQWLSEIREGLAKEPHLSSIVTTSNPKEINTSRIKEQCAPTLYIQPIGAGDHDTAGAITMNGHSGAPPSVHASSSVASSSKSSRSHLNAHANRCTSCGAGCVPPIDPFHPDAAWSKPACACFTAPAFQPSSSTTATQGAKPIIAHRGLLGESQREKYLIPTLNALSSASLTSHLAIPHSYSRCNVYANSELEQGNLIGQANSATHACHCVGPCTASSCECSRHRFGSLDPVASDATVSVPRLRHTTTSIFECQPLCQCKCVLGGPDITDVQRFHLRVRIQLIKHVQGWRVHTLEPIEKGKFVMEYSAEILTDSQSFLRELEYSSLPPSTTPMGCNSQRFIIRISQPDRSSQEPEETKEEQLRRKVLQSIASVGGRDTWLKVCVSLIHLLIRSDPSGFFVSSFDATRFGSASSFLQHGCNGNLVPVLFYPNAMRVPKILLLAGREIQRGEELILQHDAQACTRAGATGAANPQTRLIIHAA